MITLDNAPAHTSHRICRPTGTGTTLWARAYASRQRWFESRHDAESSAIHRLCGTDTRNGYRPPFRAPHHTASSAAMRGVLRNTFASQPGECSLAHGGVLYLDDGPEFSRSVMDTIGLAHREESLTLIKRGARVMLPTFFTLIYAYNPCPCGFKGNDRYAHRCRCSDKMIQAYLDRIPSWVMDLPLWDVDPSTATIRHP